MTPRAATVLAQDDECRSRYMRSLILDSDRASADRTAKAVPRTLVQFWDNAEAMPADVRECLDSWRGLEAQGFSRVLFDDHRAARYIAQNFGHRHSEAFTRCPHPAMRSDYFRLCYIARQGGFYADADDTFLGADCGPLLASGTLILQPLCYDRSTGMMVAPGEFMTRVDGSPTWIFYVNNNPLIAPPKHPVIRLALARATRLLLGPWDARPDIQSTTGPGNLSASLVRYDAANRSADGAPEFALLPEWEAIAVSTWPLSYRNDERNWRLWSQTR